MCSEPVIRAPCSGWASDVLAADRHQPGHLVLGERDLLAPELGQGEVGDLEVGGDASAVAGVITDMTKPPVGQVSALAAEGGRAWRLAARRSAPRPLETLPHGARGLAHAPLSRAAERRPSARRSPAPARDRRRAARPGRSTRDRPAARARSRARSSSARASPDGSSPPRWARSDRSVSAIRSFTRGWASESSRNTAANRPTSRAPSQPTSSLWSSSGSSCVKHGSFAFSLICVFQRYAIGVVRPAPITTGIVP